MRSGHRERMRDHAVRLLKLFKERSRISLSEIEEELGVSEATARRWVDSFSAILDIRLENGIIIVGEDDNCTQNEK